MRQSKGGLWDSINVVIRQKKMTMKDTFCLSGGLQIVTCVTSEFQMQQVRTGPLFWNKKPVTWVTTSLSQFWEVLLFLRTFCNYMMCKAEVYPHLGTGLKRLRHRELSATNHMVLPLAGDVLKTHALCCSDFWRDKMISLTCGATSIICGWNHL